ncbi:MAG: hypothetical protein HQL14_05860 [Candidatus Omnitrophica bacterium]|nr:hypothetical protein [Candidatus Omnitrophota bacterium]
MGFFLAFWGLAQGADQSSSDGVLVSGAVGAQASDQQNSSNNRRRSQLILVGGEDSSSQNTLPNSNSNKGSFNQPMDEIVIKATSVIMSQMTANMKLTQEQINTIRPIIEDNIVRTRELQLLLEKGTIDAKTMYTRREQLNNGKNQALSRILNSDQMKVWMSIQNPSD